MVDDIAPLRVIDGKALSELEVQPLHFVIARIMPMGLHMLAGSPKIGKSWLALWLCNQVSKGAPVWEFPTRKSTALYLSLEDTLDRLHGRLSCITENGSEQAYFGTESNNLANGFCEQIERFMHDYPDTGLIVVDTFQRIRDNAADKANYANDYAEIRKIKAIADKHRIAILLIHHLRKMPDNDPFNMVSGSTGIIGAVDSIYVLEKDNRLNNKAKLHVTGRDIEDMQLLLEFDHDNSVWKFLSHIDSTERKDEQEVKEIVSYFEDHRRFHGTAAELLSLLQHEGKCGMLRPNMLTRLLRRANADLLSGGISVEFRRVKGVRMIRVSMYDEFAQGVQAGISAPQQRG